MQKYLWQTNNLITADVSLLCNELKISPLLAKILINRGIASLMEAKAFLYASLDDITSPFLLEGMNDAVQTIVNSIKVNEKIVVFGDYDADGITSTYVLSELLKKAGADVYTYIPNRIEEGYGLNSDALQKLINDNIKLLITVDCGISAVKEINYACQNGMNCIITDHHNPPEVLPKAAAIINPKLSLQTNSTYDLAGVGVAWKTGWAVLEKIIGEEQAREEAFNLLEIVALGTVADMVNLHGENRIIVKYGLQNISKTSNLGLQALMEEAGVDGIIDTYKIGYMIAPRLNAAGRMSNADKALQLLQEKNKAQARARAVLLTAENSARQNVEKSVIDQAEQLLNEQISPNDKVLVIASTEWHEGVLGIVAAKILEKRYLPVICLSIKGDEAKGSARSISGFNIYEAIKACQDYVLRFGGHAAAAGLSLTVDNIVMFRQAVNAYAEKFLTEDILQSKKHVDAEISLQEINPELTKELSILEPYGVGNPKPIFLTKGVAFTETKIIGKNNDHLRFRITQNDKNLQGLAWGRADELHKLTDSMDIIYSLNENTYNGRTSTQGIIVDIASRKVLITENIKKALVLQRLVKGGKTTWEEIETNTKLNLKKYYPDRDELAVVYKILVATMCDGTSHTEEQLKTTARINNIPWETYYLALVIFFELKIITLKKVQNVTQFTLSPGATEKIKLENSPLYRQIKEEYNWINKLG